MSLTFRSYQVELYAERVNNRGLSACSQAESLKFKLLQVIDTFLLSRLHTPLYNAHSFIALALPLSY